MVKLIKKEDLPEMRRPLFYDSNEVRIRTNDYFT